MASGRRRRPGLHARRQGGAVHVAARRRSPTATRSSSPCPCSGGIEDAAADPERGPGDLLARRHSASPTTRSPPRVPQWKHYRGGTASRHLALQRRRTTRSRRSRSRRAAATTSTRCGSATRSTSAPTATASSTCSPTTPRAKQVRQLTQPRRLPGARRLAPAAAGSSTSRPASCTCSIRRRRKRDAAEDRRRRRTCARRGRGSSKGAQVHPRRGALADRRAGGVRVPRRDRHRAGREGRRRNLTNSAGVHERSPAWSPDGRSIAYFSDAAASTSCYIGSQDGKGEPRADQGRPARASTSDPVWSPDSQKIAYVDNSRALYWVDVEERRRRRRSRRSRIYGPVVRDQLRLVARLEVARLRAGQPGRHHRPCTRYSVEQDKSFQVTDGLSDVSDPVFDKSGKYLYFLASTDAGPVKDWFAQSNADMRATSDDLPRGAAERRAVAAGTRERRGEAVRPRAEDEAKPTPEAKKPTATPCREDQPARQGSAVPHRLRGPASTASSTCRFRRASCRTCRPAPPGRSTT